MKIKHTLCQQWPNELLFLKCNTFDNKTKLSINDVYTYFTVIFRSELHTMFTLVNIYNNLKNLLQLKFRNLSRVNERCLNLIICHVVDCEVLYP